MKSAAAFAGVLFLVVVVAFFDGAVDREGGFRVFKTGAGSSSSLESGGRLFDLARSGWVLNWDSSFWLSTKGTWV